MIDIEESLLIWTTRLIHFRWTPSTIWLRFLLRREVVGVVVVVVVVSPSSR